MPRPQHCRLATRAAQRRVNGLVGVEDIQQCLQLILGTPKGSDPIDRVLAVTCIIIWISPLSARLAACGTGTGNGGGHQTLGASAMRITLGHAGYAQGVSGVNLLLRWRRPGRQAYHNKRGWLAWR